MFRRSGYLNLAIPMAASRKPKSKHPTAGSPFLLLATAAVAIGLIWILLSSSTSVFRFPFTLLVGTAKASEKDGPSGLERKYLYWGNRIDCPGKHCDSCEGLGHQESSLRCALEEALYLKRFLSLCFGLKNPVGIDGLYCVEYFIFLCEKSWLGIFVVFVWIYWSKYVYLASFHVNCYKLSAVFYPILCQI